MNPETGEMYDNVDEDRQTKIGKMIADLQMVEFAKSEKRRQAEKNRRKAVEAGRKRRRTK